jgi:GT2 family glycosyltransferase
VFAVSAQSLDWEGKAPATGAWLPRLHHGWLFFEPAFPAQAVTTFFASGGFSAFRRKMFLELGGFDRLFYPAYFEETDLCYRAWQRGWEIRYEPASMARHRESPSLGQTGRVNSMMRRNQLLFQWKHLADERSAGAFTLYGWWMALRALLTGRTDWFADLRAARNTWRERKPEGPAPSAAAGFEAIASRIGLPVAGA